MNISNYFTGSTLRYIVVQITNLYSIQTCINIANDYSMSAIVQFYASSSTLYISVYGCLGFISNTIANFSKCKNRRHTV